MTTIKDTCAMLAGTRNFHKNNLMGSKTMIRKNICQFFLKMPFKKPFSPIELYWQLPSTEIMAFLERERSLIHIFYPMFCFRQF